MRGHRAFLLITVLLLCVILLTMGLAFLGSRNSLYSATLQAGLAAQARALARSGLEDARVKLNKDLKFPVEGGTGQNFYVYTEEAFDGGPNPIGSYRVEVDSTYCHPAIYTPAMYHIVSTGFSFSGGTEKAIRASHTYSTYLQVIPAYGTSPWYSTVYPVGHWEYMRFEDEGSN